MKLLLIRPPFAVEKFYFPRFITESLGIESLAAFLSLENKVDVIDAVAEGWNKYWKIKDYPDVIFQGLKPKKIHNRIAKINPEVIGISWLFSTQNDSIDLTTKEIKKINKNIPIIVGGAHPSANPAEILNQNKDIDIIVYGEGEITMQELLKNKIKNLDTIPGIAFRKENKTIVNPPRPLIQNLDSLPIPERQKYTHHNYSKQNLYQAIYLRFKKIRLDENKKIILASKLSAIKLLDTLYYQLYNKRNYKSLPAADIITSRGCPNHCTFCAIHNIWGHKWRARSAENVLKEIDLLVKKFGIKHFNIVDDNFNVDKKRVIKICKGIVENKYNITLFASSGSYVPTLDEEVLTWLKKAGLHHIRMSIESGNPEILHNVIKKNINLEQVKDILKICKKLNIHTEGAFIFGVPGETIETMKETLNYAESAGFNRVIKFIFQPFPNTELYDISVQNNYLTEDYDPKKTYITGNRCYVKTEKFNPDDVLKIINRH